MMNDDELMSDQSEDQVIDEIIQHLRMLDGDSLKRVMDEMQQMQNQPVDEGMSLEGAAPKLEEPMPDESIESGVGEPNPLSASEEGVLGSEQEMTDEEIDELLKNI